MTNKTKQLNKVTNRRAACIGQVDQAFQYKMLNAKLRKDYSDIILKDYELFCCSKLNSCLHVIMADIVEFWGLPPLILFFNMSIGWFGRFALSTECYRTGKLGYKDLNRPRCSARVTESLALTDGGFCQKQTLHILDYVKPVSL